MYIEVLTNQVTGEIIHGLHNVLLPNIVRQSITTLDYLRQHLSLIKIDVIRHNTSIVTCCCTSSGQVRNREQRCYNTHIKHSNNQPTNQPTKETCEVKECEQERERDYHERIEEVVKGRKKQNKMITVEKERAAIQSLLDSGYNAMLLSRSTI